MQSSGTVSYLWQKYCHRRYMHIKENSEKSLKIFQTFSISSERKNIIIYIFTVISPMLAYGVLSDYSGLRVCQVTEVRL